MAILDHTTTLESIREKVVAGERLDLEDGLLLMESDDVLALGELADRARRQRGGNDEVYFVQNLYLNQTNVCRVKCKFCAFAMTQKQPDAYTLTADELVEDAVAQYAASKFTEIHCVNGENPHVDLEFYADVLRKLRAALPDVHLKFYTASEIHHMAKLEGCSHGYGGSMHLYDVERGNMGANAVIGGGLPQITGSALAFQMRGEPRVAGAFFCDGATNLGTLPEALEPAQPRRVPARFGLGDEDAPLPLRGELEDDRLVPSRLVEPPEPGRALRLPDGGAVLHATTSRTASTSRAISSSAWTPGMQYRAHPLSSGNSRERSLPPRIPRRSNARFTVAMVFPVRR